MGTKSYRLKHPVEYQFFGGEPQRVEVVQMRRPTGGDMLLIDAHQDQPMRLVLEMVAALTGQPLEAVEKFDAEDVGFLGDLAFVNVGAGPKTGGTA